MLQIEAAEERTVDRELDQTAKHVHHFLGNEGCPTCKAVESIHAPAKTFSGGNEINLACDVDLGERVDEGNDDGSLDESNQQFAARVIRERRQAAEHISPSILEFQVEELKRENRSLRDLYQQACVDRDHSQNRVRQFERFTDILANHLDALQAIAHPAKPQHPIPEFRRPKAA